MTLSETLDTIIDGAHAANDQFLTLSGGASVGEYGIEPFVSSNIAMRLWKTMNAHKGEIPANQPELTKFAVTLETPFWEIADEAGSRRAGRPVARFSQGERVDVVVWNGDNRPIGVVEVKRDFSFPAMRKDIDRISHLLAKHGHSAGGSLKWGSIVGLRAVWGESPRAPETVLGDFVSKLESCDELSNMNFRERHRSQRLDHPNEYEGRKFWGFDAFAIIFRMKRA
ncbi:hypothetical protein D3218_03810 [Aureimonas flava]|uniref:Uncharacterized protein n=1 Tax=Aureimonas flava TaxID=2320271 RepID=A0A3A1WLT4_9HYPH|nr:hypothetical protein [Aureimonas flava]RIY02506.1 hypothetical protein D3218_03810 [Aureimonas flava]